MTDATDSTVRGGNLVPLSKDAVTEIVSYKAVDSVAIDLESKKAFLYKDGEIDFEDMNLKADAVELDFDRQQLRACGIADSTGKYKGRPLFKQGESEYNADTIRYNYKSGKGLIYGVITQEGDGFLHGDKIKKINDSVMYLSSGQYTTCNYAHPHLPSISRNRS
ncbi:MAG: hypothetical protein IKJ40_05445 [Bacteroidales bacterium]|nr:hypothetical protein [Bacteroidales bacterium]